MNLIENEIKKYTNVCSFLDSAMNELYEGCIVSDEWHDIYPIREKVVERLNDLHTFCKIVNVSYPDYFTEVETEDVDFNDENVDWMEWLLKDIDFDEEEEA